MPTRGLRTLADAPRGSRRWAVALAERIGLATAGMLVLLLHLADPPRDVYAVGWLLAILTAAGAVLPARVVPVSLLARPVTALAGVFGGALLGTAAYALLAPHVPTPHLFFVPFIVVAGLLGNVRGAVATAALSGAAYIGTAILLDRSPTLLSVSPSLAVFFLSGSVAGMLAEELRSHYAKEKEEQRRAVAIAHRLSAVVGAVEEGIIFTDRDGVVRMMNPRAAELFGLELDQHLGRTRVEVTKELSLQMEDPDGYIERLAVLREEPDAELRWRVEQIIPERRILSVLSRPAYDEADKRVGRVDVFVDISEEVRRAAEVERLYQEARSTAESYQRALLPPAIPSLPRVGLVAHYIPAAGRRAVCGDFYDFLTLPDGRVAVLLGDPCGVGPPAVSDGALARYTVGSLVGSESNPALLLERTNSLVADRLPPDRFVRLLVAVLDPERAVLEFASAGHVPPMLYRSESGSVETLVSEGLPLGVMPDTQFETGRTELQPGDMLFLYTDGVNEASRRGRPLGQGRLTDLVRDYGVGTPGELVQAVRRAVETWVDDDLRDDLAMVGCQVVPDTDVGEPARELVLPNEAPRNREVRAFVGAFLADIRAPVEVSSEILLATGEAAGNAAKYGRRPEGRSEVRVRCRLDGTNVVVTVADDGPGFPAEDVDDQELPDPLAPGGRGIFLMRRLMDDLDIDSSPAGTVVTMTRKTFDEPPLPSE